MKKRAKVISCSLQKGGVGKTMFAVNIAANLSTMRRIKGSIYKNKVLLIDIDTHSSATKYLGAYEDYENSIYDVLIGNSNIKESIKSFYYDYGKDGKCQIDLLPSNEVLHHIETQWQQMENAELRLKKAIEEVIYDYNYIIIDCPPESDCLLKNAFNCTDYYIIPVLPDTNSLQELAPTISQIKDLTTVDVSGKILGCCINEYKKNKINIAGEKIDIKDLYSEIINVFDTTVPESHYIDDSFANNMPIPFYSRNVEICYYIFGAFKKLTLEILDKIKTMEDIKNA